MGWQGVGAVDEALGPILIPTVSNISTAKIISHYDSV